MFLTIVGGDLNLVLNTHLVRTRKRPEGMATTGKLEGFAQAMGLRDIWRELHGGAKSYSHYSRAHGVFSRMDSFFTPRATIHRFTEAHYLARGISDHKPITITL